MDKYYGRDYKRQSAFPKDDTILALKAVAIPAVNAEGFIRSNFGVSSPVFYKAVGGAAISLSSAQQIAKGLGCSISELFEIRIISAEEQFTTPEQTVKEKEMPKTNNNFHRNSKNGEFSPKIPERINDKINLVCGAMNMNKTKFVCKAIEKECDRLIQEAFKNLRETI